MALGLKHESRKDAGSKLTKALDDEDPREREEVLKELLLAEELGARDLAPVVTDDLELVMVPFLGCG